MRLGLVVYLRRQDVGIWDLLCTPPYFSVTWNISSKGVATQHYVGKPDQPPSFPPYVRLPRK